MSFIKKLLGRFTRPSVKQLAVAGAFALALSGSIALGLQVRGHGSAISTPRDCKHNSIDSVDFGGGCGAATPAELIADIKHNMPTDLQKFYAQVGLNGETLNSGQYDNFAKNAEEGWIYRDGHITVNGQTVVTDAVSVGRDKFNNNQTAVSYIGETFYWGTPENTFAQGVTRLPVMVLFNDQGVATIMVMNPCGNPAGGHTVTPKATCKALVDTKNASNPNMHTFTTQAEFSGNATFDHVLYTIKDSSGKVLKTQTETSLTTGFSYTVTQDVNVTATVYAKVPGRHTIVAKVIDCSKNITHVAPMFTCTALVATAVDDNTFRFTIKTAQDKNTTVKNATFVLDGTQTTADVSAKDSNGNIFKEYNFTDTNKHTVTVTVFFNTLEGVKSDSGHCKATVQAKQQPKCTVPGHEGESPNSPTCGFCKPGIPIGSPQCKDTPPPTVLVNTGPGSTIAMFFGTIVAGFIGHQFFLKYRARRAAAAELSL